ncbi:MAG TPA: phosphatidylserine decarboxylase [Usitatibacter sp.]|nr:phosphatidylserine decarboxylase [Usitatibacter sp.]
MTPYPHPVIAKEGWAYLAIAVIVAAVAAAFFGWWSLPLWLAALFVLQFFRDPARDVPDDPGLVVCPADGRVLVVGKERDPYLQREALKVSIFMNVFNVHSNRSPVDGALQTVTYSAGTFLNASLDKASSGNERNTLHLRTDSGVDVTCVQVAGLVARRILCYVKAGDRLVRGERFGFIRFGSRVDVYLPPDARPRVAIGDKVKAGSTVLAELGAA